MLRIAQVAPLWESVPPRLYGGTERVVAYLCDALIDAGHDVTLFASGDSRTRARLVSLCDRPIRLDSGRLRAETAAHLALLHELRTRAAAFDVLHFHVDLLHFPMFEAFAHRTLTTLHGRLDLVDLPEAYRRWPQYPLAAISNSQRRQLPAARWIATVPHGLPANLLPFSPRGGDTLAFLGRLSPEKRPDRALAIAQRCGRKLVVAGKVDRADEAYYRTTIEPLLRTSDVRWVGEVGDADKGRILGDAAALLFPIDWPEPFGLVMIEAMACGTPVIAWRAGSVAEIVEHGVTGFVVDSLDEAIAAVARIDTLDRRRIRERFEQRFTARTMAATYTAVYRRLCRQEVAA